MKVTDCTNCSVRCTICRSRVLSPLTSNQFELQRSFIRINVLSALIFRTSSPWSLETFIRTSCLQKLGHLVFRIFKPLDVGDVHQNLCLQNLQHLIRNAILRGWDCSSELPVSESSVWLLGKTSELSDADYLHDQKHVFRSTLEWYCLRIPLLMACLLPQGQNLYYNLVANVRVPKLFIQLKYLLSSKLRDIYAEQNLVLKISPFFMMTKLCIVMTQFCTNLSHIRM